MARLLIRGGRPLEGRVAIGGAKNSALPLISAALLAGSGETVLDNVPHHSDVLDLCQIAQELGAEAEFVGPHTLRLQATELTSHVAPYRLARRLRGSTYLVGALLARLGRAEVAFPGGCAIGSRPVDFHIKGLTALGAQMGVERGSLVGEVPPVAVGRPGRLQGARFYVDRASFGTTINLMIAATLAEGNTVLESVAREPEVVDVANFLNRMGAKVRGAGTNVIRVDGVKALTGATHEVIPDRLEAGTFLLAGAITGGSVRVDNVIAEHLHAVMTKLREAGAGIEDEHDSVTIFAPVRLRAVDIETQVHPGFPTDLQSPFLACMAAADGVSVIHETVFENRFGCASELVRLGADVKVDGDRAIIHGVECLTGAPVEASDIRGGVALVLAGLAARGETEVAKADLIDRGYDQLENKLADLGAGISRLQDEAAEETAYASTLGAEG
ncbi:MAG: UDP-N-acetylglucosamine 1-carboxyvinyltransferase [Firmicutes bacterium]|nr:UDP-N-acetylglucosamine 1-carboxyvinyltransferase [Bacillota bacterium]